MTDFLRALTALLTACATRLRSDGPLIHVGDLVHCGSHGPTLDPDEPVVTERWLDDDELYAFAELVGRGLGADDDAIGNAAQEAMAHIALEEAAMRIEGDDR